MLVSILRLAILMIFYVYLITFILNEHTEYYLRSRTDGSVIGLGLFYNNRFYFHLQSNWKDYNFILILAK